MSRYDMEILGAMNRYLLRDKILGALAFYGPLRPAEIREKLEDIGLEERLTNLQNELCMLEQKGCVGKAKASNLYVYRTGL